MVVAAGSVYAVGGNANIDRLLSIEKWDRDAGCWKIITVLYEDRSGCSVVAVGSKIFIIGGGETMCDSWHIFDVTKQSELDSDLFPDYDISSSSLLEDPPSRSIEGAWTTMPFEERMMPRGMTRYGAAVALPSPSTLRW